MNTVDRPDTAEFGNDQLQADLAMIADSLRDHHTLSAQMCRKQIPESEPAYGRFDIVDFTRPHMASCMNLVSRARPPLASSK